MRVRRMGTLRVPPRAAPVYGLSSGCVEKVRKQKEDNMQANQWQGSVRRWVAGLGLAGGLALTTAAWAQESPPPDKLREMYRRMAQKAEELQANGHTDEANAVRHQMQELREKASRLERERRGEKGGADERRAMLQHHLEMMRAELKKQAEAGNEERVADIKRGIQKMEQELARLSGHEGGPGKPPLPGGGERLQHLREAINHLRAAGLNDLADKLSREADGMQQKLGGEPPMKKFKPEAGEPKGHGEAEAKKFGGEPGARKNFGEGGAPKGSGDVARLEAEVQELRQAIRRLNARLEGQGGESPYHKSK